MKTPKSRKEAKEKGLYYYYTGKPCKNGEYNYRKVPDGRCLCTHCRQVQRDCSRNYAQNPENREKVLGWKRAERKRNSDKYKDRRKRYYEENKEEIKAKALKYAKDNPEMVNKRNKERRLRTKRFTPKWFHNEREQIREIYEIAGMLEWLTGEIFHVDHIIPIKGENVCGLHCLDNLQPMPGSMNHQKGNRLQYTEYLDWLEDYDNCLFTPVDIGANTEASHADVFMPRQTA